MLNSIKQEEKLKFVFFMGDISQSANIYQFEKFESIVSKIEAKVFPLIGDHDVLQFNASWEEPHATSDSLFYSVFKKHFLNLKSHPKITMSLQSEKTWNKMNGIHSKYHNFQFDFFGTTYFGLDWASRYSSFNPLSEYGAMVRTGI
jgi:hypothetical protein